MRRTNHFYELRVKRWSELNGNEILRSDFNLDSNSVVFDVGGFLGEWTDLIVKKFNCFVYIFEPFKEYADQLVIKYKNNSKIKVFALALDDHDGTEIIYSGKDGTSLFTPKGDEQKSSEVVTKSIINFIKEQNISKIDLLKMNAEGAEFPILNSLIKSKQITIVQNILVQFHDFIENSEQQRNEIRKELGKIFFPAFNFEFVWEGWKRKNNNFEEIDRAIKLYDQELSLARKDYLDLSEEYQQQKKANELLLTELNEAKKQKKDNRIKRILKRIHSS